MERTARTSALDVAIVYGIDAKLLQRIETWRDRGYRIHVMTGVAWGQYQDYLYGRFDGINHEDEAQTDPQWPQDQSRRRRVLHAQGTNYGKFLAAGVQRARWMPAQKRFIWKSRVLGSRYIRKVFNVNGAVITTKTGSRRNGSVDARWRAGQIELSLSSRLAASLRSRARLQQAHRQTRPLLCADAVCSTTRNGASSVRNRVSRCLKGCDGYIAQVWTGIARPNQVSLASSFTHV